MAATPHPPIPFRRPTTAMAVLSVLAAAPLSAACSQHSAATTDDGSHANAGQRDASATSDAACGTTACTPPAKPCGPTNALCSPGESCAAFCDGATAKVECAVPTADSADIGESCQGRGCASGVCLGAGAEPTCVEFCRVQADCDDDLRCESVPVYLICTNGRSPVEVSICRPSL
jgi:hypothetical protein